jgi:hypothetical protein
VEQILRRFRLRASRFGGRASPQDDQARRVDVSQPLLPAVETELQTVSESELLVDLVYAGDAGTRRHWKMTPVRRESSGVPVALLE